MTTMTVSTLFSNGVVSTQITVVVLTLLHCTEHFVMVIIL